jgi:outer membrane protein assembly factor BamB
MTLGRSPARAAIAVLLVLGSCLLVTAANAGAAVGGGTQRWSAAYRAGTPAFSYDVAVSPDGSTVYSTGTTNYGTTAPRHYATVAVDAATGRVRWSAVYRSSSLPDQYDEATRIAVSPDGSRVFVTGNGLCTGQCAGGFSGASTVAYDASSGEQLWAASYPESGAGGYSIAVTPDGSKVFVESGDGSFTSATIAYDAATGHELYAIPSAGMYLAWTALAVSPDSSSVYVATNDAGLPSCGYRFTAYDTANGTSRWSALVADCNFDGNMAMALSPDGSRLYAAEYSSHGFATLALDASTGAELWKTPAPAVWSDGDSDPSVAVSPDGSRVFVVANARCAGRCVDMPLVTMAYDASTGGQVWGSTYESGAENFPADLVASADGSSVYVAGDEQMPCYSPCRTTLVNAPLIAYDAGTGAETWVNDYQNNSAFALAASPNGATVYVSGTFTTAASASVPSTRSSCSASACGFSVTAYNAHSGGGVSQDRDPFPVYDGWRTVFAKIAYGGAYRESQTPGEKAIFRTPVTRKVVWIAHAGREEGRARVLVDGRPQGMVDLYATAPATRSITFKGLTRKAHLVTIEVLGTKDRASRGRWVTVDGWNVGGNLRSEAALNVHYGAWRAVANPSASGGSYRRSGSVGDRVSLRFTGTRVDWVTATGPMYGRARVVIDGRPHIVDLYRRRRHWRARITYARLGPGTHTITIRPLGARDPASSSNAVVFDAFAVH